jgi:hypothetical protein
MAESIKQSQAGISAEALLRTEIIITLALIAKEIVSEEELVNYIRKIRMEQEKMTARLSL